MSDYEYCEKHKLSFLMPEYMMCPYCWLQGKTGSNPFDTDMANEVIDDFKTKNEKIEQLKAQNAELAEALGKLLNEHEALLMSEDCGNQYTGDEPEIQRAQKALAKYKGEG